MKQQNDAIYLGILRCFGEYSLTVNVSHLMQSCTFIKVCSVEIYTSAYTFISPFRDIITHSSPRFILKSTD